MSTDLKLDVGCGTQKRPGYVGMDRVDLPDVDIVHDMDVSPWPLGDNSAIEIIFDDVLEHSSNILGILSEVYRVSRDGAMIRISTPHFSSDNMYSDPTHKIFFSSRSLDYFDKSLSHKHHFYLAHINLKIIKSHISFREYLTHTGPRPWLNPLRWIGLEALINHSRATKRLYERFFAWILPAAELYFELQVVKGSLATLHP